MSFAMWHLFCTYFLWSTIIMLPSLWLCLGIPMIPLIDGSIMSLLEFNAMNDQKDFSGLIGGLLPLWCQATVWPNVYDDGMRLTGQIYVNFIQNMIISAHGNTPENWQSGNPFRYRPLYVFLNMVISSHENGKKPTVLYWPLWAGMMRTMFCHCEVKFVMTTNSLFFSLNGLM